MVNEKEELFIGHLIKSQEWFENKVHDYHGNKVKIHYYRYINSELKFIVNLAHGGCLYA